MSNEPNDLVCFGARCVSWTEAYEIGQSRGGWRAALPSPISNNLNTRCSHQLTHTCANIPEVLDGSLSRTNKERVVGSVLSLDRFSLSSTFHDESKWPPQCNAASCGSWSQYADRSTALNYVENRNATGRSNPRAGFVPVITKEVHVAGK